MKSAWISASVKIGVLIAVCGGGPTMASESMSFDSGGKALHGLLYKPAGAGPFPAVLYNHGSAPGLLNNQAFDLIGPIFVAHGWVFFAPYRRGQGLSSDAGPYIEDEIHAAEAAGGIALAGQTMVRLLSTEQLQDQMSALGWLKKQPFIKSNKVAVMGNSFGGIETLLGAERGGYCAAVDASGGAESWDKVPDLRSAMLRAVQHSRAPILFFQAKNDYSLAPSQTLYDAMKVAKKPTELRIYPKYGNSTQEGHSFAYRGVEVWKTDVLRFLDDNCKP
jgi:dipeptidyl aminopeptidase/acylaminoacyl peptidase